jgi:hypothetical protein
MYVVAIIKLVFQSFTVEQDQSPSSKFEFWGAMKYNPMVSDDTQPSHTACIMMSSNHTKAPRKPGSCKVPSDDKVSVQLVGNDLVNSKPKIQGVVKGACPTLSRDIYHLSSLYFVCFYPLFKPVLFWYNWQTWHKKLGLCGLSLVLVTSVWHWKSDAPFENLISSNRSLQMNVSHSISSFIQTIHKDALSVRR